MLRNRRRADPVDRAVRLEHVAGADLQIDAIVLYLEPGTGLVTWGGVKAVYQ